MHTTYRKRSGRARRPVSLLAFIRGLGGIDPGQPEAGDLRALDLHKERSKSAVKLLRPKAGSGRMIDDVAWLACEAGYIPERDINLLLEAIDREIRGWPCYRIQDVDAIPLPASAEPPEPPAVKRGRGRPPKPEGAANCRLDFRLMDEDVERLRAGAGRAGLPVRTFARQCFQSGLREFTGEGF